MALRHDERELRRRWLARVDAWCESLRRGGVTVDGAGKPTGKTLGVVESVLRELGEIGQTPEGELARETRERLEAACRAGASKQSVTELSPTLIHPERSA